MNRADHSVLTGPGDHLAGLRSGLDTAQSDLPEHRNPGLREFAEILLAQAVFEDGCSRQDFDAVRAECGEGALGGDRQGLEAHDIGRPPRQVDFAGRN